jgi:hypothetical protein
MFGLTLIGRACGRALVRDEEATFWIDAAALDEQVAETAGTGRAPWGAGVSEGVGGRHAAILMPSRAAAAGRKQRGPHAAGRLPSVAATVNVGFGRTTG